MPPKRNHDNVDVDEEGEGEDDVKTIRIVSPSTEKREQFMWKLCSTVNFRVMICMKSEI